ncbi:MAG: rhodanese-like domain-containing protein [Phycicoccus sp.]
MRFETDCWDVHEELDTGTPSFVLLDVRGPAGFAAGHVPGVHNLPHGQITERNLPDLPPDTVSVTYCNGPHCTGADRGALRLARLGRPVKKMVDGIEGWKDAGFDLETS